MNDTLSNSKRSVGSLGLLMVVLLCVSFTGCASLKLNRRSTIQRVKAKKHDTELAKSLHEKAIEAAHGNNWLKAQEWANQSVLADSDFGPAHNTLGTIYFQKDELYHAAWEFEEASKLMPDNCEPLNNLGLVYEKAGKYEDAYSYYQRGLEVSPDNIELSGNIARVRIILDDRGDDLEQLLSDLALSHPKKNWRSWARTQSEVRRFDEEEAWEYFSNGDQESEGVWVPPTVGAVSESPTPSGSSAYTKTPTFLETPAYTETPAFGVPESEFFEDEAPVLQPPLEIENGVSSRLNQSN